MKVNEKRLLESLKATFSNRFTVITELAQNGRRAKATAIHITYAPDSGVLVVEDDGVGIANLQDVLTIAESGWDEQTIKEERPFGLGALVAFATASHICIESRTERLAVATADALAFKGLTSTPIPMRCGTRVELSGMPRLETHLIEWLFRGYPIPVFLNGKEIPRPEAVDERFVASPVGMVRVDSLAGCEYDYFLQGHCVHEARRIARSGVIHLDSTLFRARAPDRSELIDADKAAAPIMDAIKALRVERLTAMIGSGDLAAIASHWRSIIDLGLAALLNAVPILPADLTMKAGLGRLGLRTNWREDGTPITREPYLSREALSALPRLSLLGLPDGDDDKCALVLRAEEINFELFMVATGGSFISVSGLDRGHWVFGLPNLIRPTSIEAEPLDLCKGTYGLPCDDDQWALRFCKSVRITVDGVALVSEEGGAVVGPKDEDGRFDEATFFAGPKANGYGVCGLFCDFEVDFGYDEAWEERTVETFHQWQSASFDGDLANLIRRALVNHRTIGDMGALLSGKRFEVSFTGGGSLLVEVFEVRTISD
ncbi:MAG: hypothetical protein E6Q76_14315 [Rhizobium sp.]|nr:MAG: hypothetical protein E6Q76_14315 [Rhizobium sp.]